ncbi:MAG: hypothetical protein DHS20C14_09960 [Phycisphaeraceae bacterium]|nr:MAG: hypothetical protein DHS20C14_09960 [Phycisphaeraceae bacterium]
MSLTLWDIMGVALGRDRPPRVIRPKRRPRARAIEVVAPPPKKEAPAPAGSMRAKYDDVTKCMLREHGVRVRKWRTSMSGVAWQVMYRDGTLSKLIESPRPRGPMSAAVFLHEIGHHAIGFGTYRPRCLEEYHAWKWSLEQMEAQGLNVTPAVRKRMRESIEYAVAKAVRRGIKALPVEIVEYLEAEGSPAFARSA